MKTATVHELKQELKTLQPAELIEICTRLARFKKENKELITYLLFEAHNEQGYIDSVKEMLDEEFTGINHSNLYFVKKSLRKILRSANKYTRYAGSKTVETELLLYFLSKIKEEKIPVHKSSALTNLYQLQLKKLKKTIETLHEDLQYDYLRATEKL